MKFQYNDGGRKAAGHKGSTSDCVTRAIAIATGLPYNTVWNAIKAGNGRLMFEGRQTTRTKRWRLRRKDDFTPDKGAPRKVYEPFLVKLGWEFVPTMGIGTGCKVHLREGELPQGRIIARVSKHLCAVIDGVLHDTGDCTRDGTRCVYGYFREKQTQN